MKEIPAAIEIAVKIMQNCFGGTEVNITSECYRLEPSEDAPAGALGCDVGIKIPNHDMMPVKMFFRNSIAEDIAWQPNQIGQMIADDIIFMALRPEFMKLKEAQS
jgi:hypothetical protein